MTISSSMEDEDVDEDENVKEMNVSIVHHNQTSKTQNHFFFSDQKKRNCLTVPGGMLIRAAKIDPSASELKSSFSPGGTKSGSHNFVVAKFSSNNFYVQRNPCRREESF